MLPLTVWLCSDTGQRQEPDEDGNASAAGGGGLCRRHCGVVGRELARHLIDCCTDEGELVAEAYTANEVVLAAAAELRRRAVACVPHPPLALHIGARLRASVPADRLAGLAMRPTFPERMVSGLSEHVGRVRLVIAAPPPQRTSGAGATPTYEERCLACRSESRVVSDHYLRAFLLAAWRVLSWGGHLAVVTTARHEAGRLVDPAPVLIRHATTLGFSYTQHVIAVRVPVQGDDLVVQPGPEELAQLRDPASPVPPPAAKVHADVYLFTKSAASRSGGASGGGAR